MAIRASASSTALRRADPHRRRKRRRDGRVRIPEAAAARSQPARCTRRIPALRARSAASSTSPDVRPKGSHERRSFPRNFRPRTALQRGATATGPHRHRCGLERTGRPDALSRRTSGARHDRRVRRAAGRRRISRSWPRPTHSRCTRSMRTSHGLRPRTARCSAPTNGGADWTLVDLRPRRIVRAVQQVGGVGWAVGDGGVVRKTSNQGATWIAQNAGTMQNAPRPRRCSMPTMPGRSATVASSSRPATAAQAGVSCRQMRRGCTRCISSMSSLASRSARAAAIVATSDGGQTWVGVAERHDRASSRDGCRSAPRYAWAAGQGGTIVRSDGRWRDLAAVQHAVGRNAVRDRLSRCQRRLGGGEGGVVLHTHRRRRELVAARTSARRPTCAACRSSAAIPAGWSATRRPRCASAADRPA